MNGHHDPRGGAAAKRLPSAKKPLATKAAVPLPQPRPPQTAPDNARPRHFASYHPVHRPGSAHDAGGGGGNNLTPKPPSSRRKDSSGPPRGRARSRSPAAPGGTQQQQQQHPLQQPRPLPSPRFLSPDASRRTRDTSAPPAGVPSHPPTVKSTRSMSNIRGQNVSSPRSSVRNDNHAPRSAPVSPARGPPPVAARRLHRQSPADGRGSRPGDLPRSSSLSATTRTSSINQTSATERSSMMTRSSSTTDITSDTAAAEDGGMSVDDAIAMYLDGFMDDPIPESLEESSEESRPSPQDSLVSINGTASEQPAQAEKAPTLLLPTSTGGPPPASPSSPTVVATPQTQPPPPPLPPSPLAAPAAPADAAPDSAIHEPRHFGSPPQNEPRLSETPSADVPPPLSAVSVDRDQYGFHKSNAHITIEQYDSWYSSYANYVESRRLKWVEMLTTNGLEHINPTSFPSRSFKMKRYVRKGIPPEFRGSAWFWYADGPSHLHRNPGLYHRLVETASKRPMNDDKEHIERDLHRTFPDNIHFKPQTSSSSSPLDCATGDSDRSGDECPDGGVRDTPIIQALRRVLYAFSVHNPKIGYTQSLNFVAGMLLLFLPEEKAFWMLHVITSTFLPGTHEISLEGANADLWILMVVLKESLPAVYTKVASPEPTTPKTKAPAITTTTRLPDITLGLTNWLMSMFISSLPLETTLRVWDVLFYEGPRTFFRVALAIFRLNQKDILAVGDPMEIFQLAQTAPKQMLDPNALLNTCFARRFRLSQSRLGSLRAARREAIRADKQRLSQLAGPGKLRAGTDWRPNTAAAAANALPSAWRSLKNHLR